MKKRTAFIGAIFSLISLGQPLIIKTGAVVSTTGFLLSVSEKVYAGDYIYYYYFYRAFDKAKRGEHHGAISNYTKAIEINPNEASTYFHRGLSKQKLKDYYGAIYDYTKAIEINPYDVSAYFNRGFSKQKLKDYNGAIYDYTKAIEINPYDEIAYNNRGIAKRKIGDDKGGCYDYKKAIALGNKETEKWYKTDGAFWCRDMEISPQLIHIATTKSLKKWN